MTDTPAARPDEDLDPEDAVLHTGAADVYHELPDGADPDDDDLEPRCRKSRGNWRTMSREMAKAWKDHRCRYCSGEFEVVGHRGSDTGMVLPEHRDLPSGREGADD